MLKYLYIYKNYHYKKKFYKKEITIIIFFFDKFFLAQYKYAQFATK